MFVTAITRSIDSPSNQQRTSPMNSLLQQPQGTPSQSNQQSNLNQSVNQSDTKINSIYNQLVSILMQLDRSSSSTTQQHQLNLTKPLSVFVTSACGATGRAVIDALSNSGHDIEIVAGAKDLSQVSSEYKDHVSHQVMDIVSTSTANNQKVDFQGCEMLFIIPPCSS